MQTETLRHFCETVQARSFTKAAERRGITQSAVSQRFSALEKELDARLAMRHPNNFQLTPAGEIVYHYGRQIVRLAAELDRLMREAGTTAGSVIELAACHSIGLHQLPPILRRFRRDFPEIEVRVSYGLIDRVHEVVLNNEIDLGLVCYPRRLHGLAVDTFRHERLMLVCHPQHPLASCPAVAVPELKGQKFVAWTEIRWSPFLRNVPDCQRHLFEPRHEFNQVEMVKRVVEMDEGIAILPEAVVLPEIANHMLAAVPFENSRYTEPLAVIYRKARVLTPAMKQFIQFLKQPEPEDLTAYKR